MASGLVFWTGVEVAWAQGRSAAKTPKLPDFDARDQAGTAAAPQNFPDAALVDRRRAVAEAYLGMERTVRPGVRMVLDRYGLPKVYLRDGGLLSGPSGAPPEEIAKGFLRSHTALFPFASSEVDDLRLTVNDAGGGAIYLVFQQTVGGVDVFEGQVRFTLTKAGEIVQAGMSGAVPNLSMPLTPRLSPEEAVRQAAADAGQTVATLESVPAAGRQAAFRNPFRAQFSPVTAELNVFPLGVSAARLCYRVFLETSAENWYELLIDAGSGALLYRHNLYAHAGSARVWTQSPMQGSRQLVTFPEGWLPPGILVTTGNNADAFWDSYGFDSPTYSTDPNLQTGRAYSPSQVFDFPYGDGLTGQDPRLFPAASVTNLFYYLNVAHDFYYGLGFTEAAGNFQTDNLGRGGLGGDAIIGEAQYGGFTNNSSFSLTPDGTAPRMRMGLYTRGTSALTDDLDSDYNGFTVFHEYMHGVSTRLVGARTSTSCLNRIQSGAMGEGWGDYFAISYFNNPIYGTYNSQNLTHGTRRFSYEGYPYTYEDLGNGSYGYEVHDDGEIWAAVLWDLRKSLGQAVTDQLVINGLKATPCHPSMTDARDALLSADQATHGGANRAAIWQVFARHGLGYSAVGVDGTVLSGTRYDAAGDLPPDLGGIRSPAVTSNPLVVVGSLGSLYSYTPAVSNPSSGTLHYTLSAGPVGMTVDAATGALSWTAAFVTGPRVQLVITDGLGGRLVHGYALPILTTLSADTPVVIAGPFGTTGYSSFTVPSGTPVLQVTLRGGTGDADLWVANPDGHYEYSRRIGNSETLSYASPKAGRWQIEVDGYETYAGVSLTASLVTPTLLGANATLTLSGVLGSETLYRLTIPSGATQFTVSTSGGTGDVDLYLKKGSPALCQASSLVSTACYYDSRSANYGNSDSISRSSPAAGDWYLDLSGYAEYAGVTLTTVTTVPSQLLVDATSLTFTAVAGGPPPAAKTVSVSNPAGTPYSWSAQASTTSGGSWLRISPASGSADAVTQVTVDTTGVAAGTYAGTITITAPGLADSPKSVAVSLTVSAPGPGGQLFSSTDGLYFFPTTPCHLVDTTGDAGFTGEFGPPSVNGGQSRTFHPNAGGCPGIPLSAKAFSLNITAIPTLPGSPLNYLTIWPAGQPQPFVSTLNGPKGGYVSNAVFIPAGTDGGVSVFVTETADLLIDINGYFDTEVSANANSFYALAPCRVADTREALGAFGGPQLAPEISREFPVGLSPCLPANAGAHSYSLNMTAIPAEPLRSLAIWPGASVRPARVSTLSASYGDVTANAVLAHAGGSNGAISLAATHRTDVAIDINGYFAARGGAGDLLFHPVSPCRVADTREAAGPFGGPIVSAGTSRTFAVPLSPCNLPANASAYSFNVTVVPNGLLGYLTIWPAGQTQPYVSTLNSWDGRIVANAAVVPAGQDGAVSVFATNDTHVFIDVNGYFGTAGPTPGLWRGTDVAFFVAPDGRSLTATGSSLGSSLEGTLWNFCGYTWASHYSWETIPINNRSFTTTLTSSGYYGSETMVITGTFDTPSHASIGVEYTSGGCTASATLEAVPST